VPRPPTHIGQPEKMDSLKLLEFLMTNAQHLDLNENPYGLIKFYNKFKEHSKNKFKRK